MTKKDIKLTLNLAKNDIKKRFAGSYLGIFWAFIQPVLTVLVYWFVFEVGFRQSSGEYPFVLFLVTGIVPWFFFADCLVGAGSSFLEYSFLVKKVVFKIDILPLVKILSALFIHLFFVAFMMVILFLYGYYPKPAMLQIIYYMACNIFLSVGIGYFISVVIVFFRDMQQFVNLIVIQFGMWLTPILWNASDVLGNHPTLAKLFKFNPMYYIVDGFRDALLYDQVTIISKYKWGVYFWVVAFVIFIIGMALYRKLKPHFADIL